MPACVLADDAYLLAAYPGVVVWAPEVWLVQVVSAEAGPYTVAYGAAQFTHTAGVGEQAPAIADSLVGLLGTSMLAAASPAGESGLTVAATSATPLALTVSGPSEGAITATLTSGGDTNAASRAFWLARAACGLPPCCNFTSCPGDYTLMHAALAAHYIYTAGGLTSSGASVDDFTHMRLGPATLTKGTSAWAGNPADAPLSTTAPGQLYLMLRARYVLPIFCAGPSPAAWRW